MPERIDHHEVKRIRSLTLGQLEGRIQRCSPEKLTRFYYALVATENSRLAQKARERLLSAFGVRV
jgi:hypothetical protein